MIKRFLLLLPTVLCAGGFYLQLGNPEASLEARRMHAVLTVTATGCHDPATAKLTATAIGVVNGERREIPLSVSRLDAHPGFFAIAQQWPKQGKWVLRLEARNAAGQYTNSLILAGPNGIDARNDKAGPQAFTSADIDSMLK